MDDDFRDLVRSDVDAVNRLVPDPAEVAPVRVDVHREDAAPVARSTFDVDRLLGGAAAFAGEALAALPQSAVTQRSIDMSHLLAWCTSTVLVDGQPVPQWADLSGVYATRDGRHLQLHCNFPHHAEGVLRHLDVPADREALAAAIAQRDGETLERELIDADMIAALVRTTDEWDAHPHAVATRHLPLVTVERIGDAPPSAGPPPSSARTSSTSTTSSAPALRVLDCTRVLAGPVAGHLLASAGCDVIRLGAAHLPSVDVGVLSTGFGKRNAFADLRTDEGRRRAEQLVAGADVWLDAYRPGSLAGHGLDAQRAAELRPGIVVVQISAFDGPQDTDGPWAGRRGFDSIVQSTTGVRWAGGVFARGDDTPRGLPVQALDHATGFLAAGVAARLVAHQRTAGGSWLARLSLLRTRNRLVELAPPVDYEPGAPAVPDDVVDTVDAPAGRVSAVRAFLGRWGGPPLHLGSSPPSW